MTVLLANQPKVLFECSVVERLRRDPRVALHSELVHAPLIYEPLEGNPLATLYCEYIDIARTAALPLVLTTPTWRTNRERVATSGIDSSDDRNVNADAVRFVRQVIDAPNTEPSLDHPCPILVGAMLGSKNDCYRPDLALDEHEAEDFHSWQVERLSSATPDFLVAETMPELNEARGMARALARTSLPMMLSFVIRRDGCLLDGTPLGDAIADIDGTLEVPPLGYLVNCAYPTFLHPEKLTTESSRRLIGYLANASSLDHCELEASPMVQSEPVEDFAREMGLLHRQHGIRLLGGCCGTDGRHLQALARL